MQNGESAMKTKSKRVRRRQTLGEEIIEGLTEALAFERGEKTRAVVRRVPVTARKAEAKPAPDFSKQRVARLRKQLGISQPVFAQVLNVSPETVKSWEQGKNAPGGPAARLLEIAESHPEVVLASVRAR
jgi:putative transcriptional regulator